MSACKRPRPVRNSAHSDSLPGASVQERTAMALDYKFSFGPWNIHEGSDPFGPPVRPTVGWAKKLPVFKQLGFDAVMFHDDDVVPQIEEKQWPQIEREAR